MTSDGHGGGPGAASVRVSDVKNPTVCLTSYWSNLARQL